MGSIVDCQKLKTLLQDDGLSVALVAVDKTGTVIIYSLVYTHI
jgi:hypothetical protein